MLRRPSYKQFLNQTIAVQSAVHLPANENGVGMARTAGEGEMRRMGREGREGKVLEVVKYLPNDPVYMRHTYKGTVRTKDEVSCSFKATSPARIIPRPQQRSAQGNRSEWRPSWKDSPNPTPPQHPPKQSNLLPPSPLLHVPSAKPSTTLYQSKSSTRLGTDPKSDKQTIPQGDSVKKTQPNNGRIADNANFQKNAIEKSSNQPPVSTTLKESRSQERSVSPLRQATHTEMRFTPIQFKRKQISGTDNKPKEETAVSPYKRQTATTIATLKTEKSFATTLNLDFSRELTRDLSRSKAGRNITIEEFEIGKKLGEGRFGVVWVAIHKLTGAIFALKKIPKAAIRSNLMVDQFLLEAKVQSYFENPYLVRQFGLFDDSEHLYLLLEYLQGGTLYAELKKQGKLTDLQASHRVAMLCQAVKALHDQGVAHRDIKPENVMVTHGTCKLGDFGWATRCDQRRMTYCGTTDYVAPQIVQGLDYDLAVDLWCIGVLTYELLAGKPPFYHISRQQTFKKIANVDSSSITYPSHFSGESVDFIAGLVRKNPAQRMSMDDALRHPFIIKHQL